MLYTLRFFSLQNAICFIILTYLVPVLFTFIHKIHILYTECAKIKKISTEYFKHGIYSPFLPSSKCYLFHNSNVFDSCIIHILHTGCAKIKKIIPAPKG